MTLNICESCLEWYIPESCSWIIMSNEIWLVLVFFWFLGCRSPKLTKPQNWLFWGHLVLPGKNRSNSFEWSFFCLLLCWFFRISAVSFYWSSVFFLVCFGGVLEIDNQPSEQFEVASNQVLDGSEPFLVKENGKTPEVVQFWLLFLL